MATAEIKTLTNADGSTVVYPRTTVEAVYGIENMGTRLESVESQIEPHVSNKNNPHGVTLSQLGITVSTSAPSGGANGDIWIQYS